MSGAGRAEVRWTRLALADPDETCAWTAVHRTVGEAAALAARLRAAAEGLRAFPERGRPGRVPGTRELVVPGTPFVVVYRTSGRDAEVLAVLHGARAWPPSTGR